MIPKPVQSPKPFDFSLEKLRRGERETLEGVLRHLLPSVRGWLQRLLGPRELDDATQDALIALAKSLPKFRGDSALSTYAHRVTVRVAYRYFKSAPSEGLQLVAPSVDALDPESRAIAREALRRLRACLERMPPKRRVAFVLCCVEGLSPKEAAQVAGCARIAMRSRLLKARQEVERRLGHDPYIATLLQGGER